MKEKIFQCKFLEIVYVITQLDYMLILIKIMFHNYYLDVQENGKILPWISDLPMENLKGW